MLEEADDADVKKGNICRKLRMFVNNIKTTKLLPLIKHDNGNCLILAKKIFLSEITPTKLIMPVGFKGLLRVKENEWSEEKAQ